MAISFISFRSPFTPFTSNSFVIFSFTDSAASKSLKKKQQFEKPTEVCAAILRNQARMVVEETTLVRFTIESYRLYPFFHYYG